MRVRAMSRLGGLMVPAIVLTGCVLSIDAVVSESDANFDARLLGAWEEVSGSDRAVVSRASESTYAIEYTSDGKVTRLEARLGSLDGRSVLDVWPTPRDGDLPEGYAGLMVAGHLLFLIDVSTNEISIAMLEPDSLLAGLRTEQPRLGYRRSEDQLVLYGTTEELRAALGPYLAKPGALMEPDVWRRAQSIQSRATPRALPVEVPCFEASAWRDADLLFRRDPHWVGADGASSVDLGGGRTLWLFGDSWIDPSGKHTRQGARMISNSVAIQTGTDPANSSIAFYWGSATDGSPAPFFPDRGGERLWLGNGVRLDNRLVLFFNRIRSTNTGLGFESVGWTAVIVDNPDAEPSAWRLVPLETPTNPLGVIVGYAAVLQLGEYVYALGSEDPVKSHPVYVVRWPAAEVRRGNLFQPEWWAGERLGWVPDSSSAPRWPVFENGQSDLTVHFDKTTQRFVEVQTVGFGPAYVAMRAAPELTGPWTAPRMVYRPPEYDRPNVMIYSAKAHPQLTGGDVVVTYATNTFRFAEHLTDSLIYYPRFVRLSRCR